MGNEASEFSKLDRSLNPSWNKQKVDLNIWHKFKKRPRKTHNTAVDEPCGDNFSMGRDTSWLSAAFEPSGSSTFEMTS